MKIFLVTFFFFSSSAEIFCGGITSSGIYRFAIDENYYEQLRISNGIYCHTYGTDSFLISDEMNCHYSSNAIEPIYIGLYRPTEEIFGLSNIKKIINSHLDELNTSKYPEKYLFPEKNVKPDRFVAPIFPVDVLKPAIYLYPIHKSNITVNLKFEQGELTTSNPPYHNGWSVSVDTEGIINGKYDYLFYENKLYTLELPDEGWIVRGENLSNFFDKYLFLLGLRGKEIAQFEKYWLKKLDINRLYEIKILDRKFLDKYMKLTINPKPDNLIRVIFSFRSIKHRYNLLKPQIITPSREGFCAVEWGGLLLNSAR